MSLQYGEAYSCAARTAATGCAMSDRHNAKAGKQFEHAKQNRGAEQIHDKPGADSQKKQPVEEAKAPSMPALGGAGDPLAGGMGGALNAAESDPKAMADQQAELQRVKALPAGAPELEKFKKPEALASQVPEGAGATGDAKAQSEGMSPKGEAQAPATLGANAQQVKTEPGGDKVEVQKVEVASAPPTSAEAGKAVANAGSAPAAATAPQEAPTQAAPEPAKKDVAPESAEKKQPEQPTAAQPEAAAPVATEAKSAEPGQAAAATPEQAQTGNASADAEAATKEPEKAPELAPQQVAGVDVQPASVDAAPAEGAQLEGPAQVAELTASQPAPQEVAGAAIAELPVEQAAVAAESVPEKVAGDVAQTGETKGETAPGSAEVAPVEAAPTAQGAAPAAAADAAVAQAADAALAAVPADAKAAIEQVAVSPAESAAGDAGAAPQPVAASEPKADAGAIETVAAGAPAAAPAGAEASVEAPAALEEAATAPQALATAGETAGPALAEAPVAPAAEVVAEDGAEPAVATAAPLAAARAISDTTAAMPVAQDAGAQGDLNDPFAGMTAAGELGAPAFGQTALQASEQALAAPLGVDPTQVEAIASTASDAGLDPAALLGDKAKELQEQVQSLLGAGEKTLRDMGKGAAASASQVVDQAKGQLDDWLGQAKGQVDEMGGKGQELLDKGQEAIGGAKGAMDKLQNFGGDIGGAVKEGLGAGKALPDQIRGKAEQALGMDLSGVQLHDGADAQALADKLGATAFAQGSDIVMGKAAELAGADRDQILAEEIVHVAQMQGKSAADRGATGVSVASDRAEKSARTAAEKVLGGARVKAEEIEGERRAVYRNDNGQGASGSQPTMPTQVSLSLGGKSTVVKLPKLTAGTTNKMVSLPSLGVRGLSFESQARLEFDSTSGQFKGGKAWASIKVGDVISLENTQVTIDQNGQMKGSFPGATFKLGSLINETITADVGAGGVTGKGTYEYSQLRGDKLGTWLRSGSLSLSVDAGGAVSGSGTLGVEVGEFSPGTLKAAVQDKTLSGQVDIDNKVSISLGKASASDGHLSGALSNSDKVELSGALKLDIPSLTGGKGTVQAKWDSEGSKITGQAAYESSTDATWGKVVFSKASVTGTVEDGKIGKMAGNGTAVYDSLFKGNWNGTLDLDTEKASFELGGELAAPLIQGEVQVSKGALTIKVDDSNLTSTAGNVDFKLGSFLKGTAVLEEGTNANTINATATAELVSAQSFDGVTLSKGSITVQVRGTQVSVQSGSVDLDYKSVAKGQLNLSSSEEIRRFTGSGKANLSAGLLWGDIKVVEGAIDVSLKDNVVEQAQGQMKMGYLDFVEGQMAFDAKNDFTAIDGTATAHLSGPKTLTGSLKLVPDTTKKFDLEFKNSTFKSFKGAFAWEYDKFKGDLQVANAAEDFGLVTGTGKADLLEDLPIGTIGSTKLMGKKGSDLTGKIENGSFMGVSGTLQWEYDKFLAGKATIAEPRTNITEIDGILNATVIAEKALPNNPAVVVQPGAADALSIQLTGSVPVKYSGTLDYKYDSFLQGNVHVAGEMLDFSTLAGQSQGTVYAPKTIGNVKALEGSTMNVEFADSKFSTFSGSIKMLHKDWLKGTVEAVEGGGSAMNTGVTGQVTGSIAKKPPFEKGSFSIMAGGKVTTQLALGQDVTTLDAGSEINWKFEDWLKGKLTLDQQAALPLVSGSTNSATITKPKPISADKKLSFLESGGLGVKMAASSPEKYTGSVKARYDKWIEGTFTIGEGSGAANFNGDLTGALIDKVPLGDSGTELQPGGSAKVSMTSNAIGGISGTLEFQFGKPDKWLKGTVGSATSSGAGITNISGNVTGSIMGKKPMNNMELQEGGAITTTMESSNINKLGGVAAFKFGQGAKWLTGNVTLDQASTPTLVSGTHASSIDGEFVASTQLKLTASSGLTGQVQQNDVTTLGGPVGWLYESWMAGTAQAPEADPKKVSGSGDASIVKPKELIPGKLSLIEGGGFQAQIDNAKLTKFWGDVPFKFEDWAKGTVNVANGTVDGVTGAAKFGVQGAGKTFENAGLPVKMNAGGDLNAQLTRNGLEHFGGTANAEIGRGSDGKSWHVLGSLTLADSEMTNIKGDFDGALAGPLDFPPALRIEQGGSVKFHIEGSNITQPTGDVNYTLKRGTAEFVKGSMTIDASSTTTSISGALHGTVATEQQFGDLKILPGGKLDGTLQGNSKATLGGNLAFQYQDFLKGSVQIDGQLDPDQGKVNGQASATTLAGTKIGALTIGAGSEMGGKVQDSALKNIWGKLNFSTDKLQGVVEVPQGSNSTPDHLSGDASAKLVTDLALGGGFSIKSGSTLAVKVADNQLTDVSGGLNWAWNDKVGGTLTAGTGSTLQQISGTGTAEVLKRIPVGSGSFALLPGSGIGAKVVNNALDSVSGGVRWEYGEGGWLAGALTLPDGTKIDAPTGKATAGLVHDKQMGQLNLRSGGQLQVDIAAGAPTSFQGQLLWGYSAADQWLQGDVTLNPTASLDQISGSATAKLAKEKTIGDSLVLLQGGSLTGTMTGSRPEQMSGEVNWRYQNWLEGKVNVQASNLDTIQGQADAHLVDTKMAAPGFELQKGGNIKVTVGQSAIKSFTGEVGWKYGEGGPFAEGKVAVTAESTWESISGKADAQLTQDVQAAADLKLLKEGSGLQVEISGSKVQSFGGHIGFLYGEGEWLKGAITVTPGSTPKKIGGEADAAIVADRPVDGTELTLKPGSKAQVKIADNDVKSFKGKVNWAYGADPWLKGSLEVAEGSTAKHVTGKASATLSKYKRVSDTVKFLEGGTISAQFDGATLKQFSGDVTVAYDDWLQGNIHVDNSDLESVSGSLKGSLQKHKPVTADLTLKQGGSVELKLQNSDMVSFAGDVDWSYQQWLEGNLHVDAGTGKDITGTGNATLRQQKTVGDGGKLELQRGSALQAKFTNSNLDGVGGDLAWRYDGWLKGTVGVPAYTKLDNPSGTITASLHTDKQVGADLTLQRGGSVGGELSGGKLTKIQGQVEWKYQDWLGGSVVLDPSAPEAPTGKATASIIAAKEVKPPLTLQRGGSMQLGFDSKKSMTDQAFSANLTWEYDKWLGGDLTVNAGSTFANLSGNANVALKQEKQFGELTLRRGGQARAVFAGSKPESFGGDLNWQYQTWLGGSINVADGSKFESLSGKASAALLEDKPLGNQFTLVAGGHAQVEIAQNKVDSFGGTVFYKWKDWVDGSVDVAGGSKLDKISGKATVHLSKDWAVGGSAFTIKQGTSATGEVKDSSIDSISGKLGWKYENWAEGNLDVQSSKLDSVSGTAQARIVGEKPLGGDLKLLPGGSAEVEVKANQLTSWGGEVSIGYKELAKGSLAIEGKTADLKTVNGEAKARLIADLPMGTDAKLLNGSGIGVKVKSGNFDTFSGLARFQYKDSLAGTVELKDSKADNLNGSASAQVIKDFAPANGQFFLTQGGNLRTEFKNSAFETIEGEVTWKYDNPSANLDGRLTVPKSPISSIKGEGTARLLQDTAPVQNTKLLQGGHLSVKVEASAPKSLTGQVSWQHAEWLGGSVELQEGTNITGPFKGKADAVLKQDKQLNSKFTANKGGSLQLTLDTSTAVDQASVQGMLAVQYEDWLKGSLTLDSGSNFKNVQGAAKVELIADKDLGSSGVKLLQGGNIQAKFDAQGLKTFGGVVMADYQQWLSGSINVNTNSTIEAITGKATVQLTKEKPLGDVTLLAGGQASIDVQASKLAGFGGVVNLRYQDWIRGSLNVSGGSTLDSIGGQGDTVIEKEKQVGGDIKLKQGGHARITVANSAFKSFSGEVNVDYQDWLSGGVVMQGESTLDSISGNANLNVTKDKDLAGQVKIKQGGGVQGSMVASKVTNIMGTLAFEWKSLVGGSITLNNGSTLEHVSGSATVALLKDYEVGGGVKLAQGGNATVDFDGTSIKSLSGTLALEYQDWLQGTVQAKTGSTLAQISGTAELSVKAPKTFGKIAIKEGSSLAVDFAANTITEYRGNVEVGYEEWLKGNLNFKAQDLNSISGKGSLQVLTDHPLAGPLSILQGSYVAANFEASSLKDFGGTIQVGVKDWGKGTLTVKDGSTPQSVSGEGKIEMTQPKKLGQYVTITHGSVGAIIENNDVKNIYGDMEGEVKDFGTGWLKMARTSTLTSFDGQAGLKLTTPKKIGNFAELSGGKVIANFEQNNLKDFGGEVDIKVIGWGKGNITIDSGSTLDYIKGSGKLELTETKSLAGGLVKVTGGSVGATVDGQKLTRVAGSIKVQIKDDVAGELRGEIDVEREKVSGQGTLKQLKAWNAGPVKVQDGTLSATVTDNKMTGASGGATLDAGKFGRGHIDVNYEDVGGTPVFYGAGWVEFQPHERVKGRLDVNLSREQKFTGEGQVQVKISDKINGMVGVALDDQGHVKLKGSVTIPGPFELFKPTPYKKDISLLDLSFVVYTPPTVKVKVGAGLGIECGIKPLTLSNLVIGGEVDLMEPSFASMSVSGHLASSAYADINAYVQGSVQVSAAVVAVEAGLRAALNLHLEAALSADPTITVNRNGLSFDMPVDARLSAALNLVLTFFAKVKVGLDVGLFSIMKTVWRYEKSPDPLRLAEMSIGAKGRVKADAGGFSGEMHPEYQPPDLSLESLKRALHLD